MSSNHELVPIKWKDCRFSVLTAIAHPSFKTHPSNIGQLMLQHSCRPESYSVPNPGRHVGVISCVIYCNSKLDYRSVWGQFERDVSLVRLDCNIIKPTPHIFMRLDVKDENWGSELLQGSI
jgi:hypothetical protein